MKKIQKATIVSHDRSLFHLLVISILSLCLITLVGCGSDSSTSANGDLPNNNDDDNNGGEEIGFEPTFTNIQMVFNQSCGGSGCHIGNEQSGVQLDSFDNVIGSIGDQYGTEVVEPGDAAGSPLVDKIEPNPQIGSRMPEDGPPFLSQERIDQIRDWIDEGAENN